MKIFHFTQGLIQSSYISLCFHRTNIPAPVNQSGLLRLNNHYYIE